MSSHKYFFYVILASPDVRRGASRIRNVDRRLWTSQSDDLCFFSMPIPPEEALSEEELAATTGSESNLSPQWRMREVNMAAAAKAPKLPEAPLDGDDRVEEMIEIFGMPYLLGS